MKRTTFVALALVFALGVSALGGCASEQAEDTANGSVTPEEEVSGEEEATVPATATPSDGSFWGDVPVYATAMQLQKAAWSIPPQDDSEYTNVEWRYYELSAGHSVQMVASFYKMEMPKNGWQQMMEMEVQEVAMLFYTKNNEDDASYVWAAEEDGKTVFALMRATR